MRGRTLTPIYFLLLLGIFLALTTLNNQLLKGLRIDLTQDQIYTLSAGSKSVLDDIDEPINLYFYFSDKSSTGMTVLRNYADRVESLLSEFESASNGKIKLNVIDPEPFSQAEDDANQYGLTAASLGAAGDSVYMGLAATNAVDEQKVIPFFDPQQEAFLEYQISKLIYQLQDSTPLKVALMSDINFAGGQNPMTGQFDPAWTFVDQLSQLYDVSTLGLSESAVPDGTEILLLIQPRGLSDALRYSIDQFAMNGGKIMVFADPHFESDAMSMMGAQGANSADINSLFDAWGLTLGPDVVLDATTGLEIRSRDGGVLRHTGFLGLQTNELDRNDITTSGLESINGASFGALNQTQDSALQWTPLMRSSDNAMLINADVYAMNRDPETLLDGFAPAGKPFDLAVRLSGSMRSAYPQAPELDGIDASEHLASTDSFNAIIVADVDLLADRFWVQQANFFGQTIFTPFANNGDWLTNAVENFSGGDALISIRSRGMLQRPFEVVDALTVKAEAEFRAQEEKLQAELTQTEQELAALQSQQAEGGALVLSPEQQASIDNFIAQRIDIRKALRDVRHQLDKDIESLGNQLKLINVLGAPVVLTLALYTLARLVRRRYRALTTGV